MRPSRLSAALTLCTLAASAAACIEGCGLSAEGTGGDVGLEGRRDATADGPRAGQGSDDATSDGASPDATAGGDDATADVARADDAEVDGADSSTGDDGGADAADGEATDGALDDGQGSLDAADAARPPDGSPGPDAGGAPDAGPLDASVDGGGPGDAGTDHTDAAPADAGASPDATVDGGGCDFDGVWGSRLTIDVSWQPQGLNGIILASGTGQIKQWIKGVRTQTGLSTSDATVVCGIVLPDFQETVIAGGETYGVRFPDSLFDNDGGVLPTFTVSAALSGTAAGSTYGTTTTAVLLGLSMTSPTTDPWPATITTQLDMDHDGKPGVTVDTAQGSPYSDIPTGLPPLFGQPVRADRLYVAIRQVTVVTGTVDDCSHMSGTVSIPQISSKYAIDSHVLGCTLEDGGDCSTTAPITQQSQAAFVDNTQPVFTPSGTTDFHSVRLAAGATCADVRAALP